MVDCVECGTEVKKAEHGEGAHIRCLVNVRHNLDCCCLGRSIFLVGGLELWKELRVIKVANDLFL